MPGGREDAGYALTLDEVQVSSSHRENGFGLSTRLDSAPIFIYLFIYLCASKMTKRGSTMLVKKKATTMIDPPGW
jgi:hypothetical protein